MDPETSVRDQCPPDDVWAKLAAGVIRGPAADKLLTHSAQCESCAIQLKEAIYLLGPDAEAEPVAPMKRRWWPVLAIAAALLITVGVWSWRVYTRPPLALLAQAYTSHRPFEMRIGGAKYGAVRVERGSPSAGPPELLEAAAAIQRHVKERQEDAPWLHAEGRAALLDRRFDAAIQSFQAAAQLGERAPDFWVDFATAYYGRAEARSMEADYTKAIELLGHALERDPNHAAALFNRALVYEKLSLIDPAIRDLEACLKIEKDAGWSEEARQRLDRLRKKRAHLFNSDSAGALAEMRFEQVLRGPLSSAPQSGLAKLASELEQEHGDSWLTEMLDVSPGASAEIALLARIAELRSSWRSPMNAVNGPANSKGPPVAAWRDFEQLAKASSGSTLACPDSSALVAQCERRHYRWFAIQALLARSTCDTRRGDLDAADRSTFRAIELADTAHYPIAAIRAKGFLSSHAVNQGRFREAIRIARESLEEIVAGTYPTARAHQFYNDIMRSSEQMERWSAASAAEEMAIAVAQGAGSKLHEILGRCKLAEFAHRLGNVQIENEQYSLAAELGTSLPPASDAAQYTKFAQIGLLQSHGDSAGLEKLKDELQATPGQNLFLEAPLWNAIARLALDRRDSASAETAARQALTALLREAENAPEHPLRSFRHEHESASALLVDALLLRGAERPALDAWREFSVRDSAMVGHRASSRPLPRAPGPDSAVITLAGLNGRLGIWTETSARARFRWADRSLADVLSLARRLNRLSSSPRFDPASAHGAARELGQALFPGEWPSSIHHVQVEARGELIFPLRLVLESLSRSNVDDAVFGSDPPSAKSPAQSLSIVAPDKLHPRFEAELPALPDTHEEISGISASFPRAEIVSGMDATPARVALALSRPGVFHFTGHAIPWRNGIGLVAAPHAQDANPDRRIGIWQVQPEDRFNADLAFLAACSTAAFEDTDTAVPARLAEAVLAAGVPRVIATLWDVDSGAAHRFANAFYAALGMGHPVRLAFENAGKAVRSDVAYRHPYYWAPFVLFESVQ